jgi:hypothetical protein
VEDVVVLVLLVVVVVVPELVVVVEELESGVFAVWDVLDGVAVVLEGLAVGRAGGFGKSSEEKTIEKISKNQL